VTSLSPEELVEIAVEIAMDISKEILEKSLSDVQEMQNEINALLVTSEDDSKDFKAEIEGVNRKLSEVAEELSFVSDKYRDKLENHNLLLWSFNEKLVNHSKLLARYVIDITECEEQTDNQQLPRCSSLPQPVRIDLPIQVRSPDTSACLTHSTVTDSPTMHTKHQTEELRSRETKPKDIGIDIGEEVRRIWYPPISEEHINSPVWPVHNKASSPNSSTEITTVYVPSATSPQEEKRLHTEIIGREQQFRYPYQVANGCNRELIVTDRCNHHLLVFDENLEHLYTYGEYGFGEGKFYNPTGLAVDVEDRFLYVSDHNNIIQKFSIKQLDSHTCPRSPLEFIGCYGGKGSKKGMLLFPCGLACSNKGLGLFVCDYGNHRIQVFTTKTDFYSFGQRGSGPGEFIEPHSIVLNHDEDKVFVCDHSNNRIQVFRPNGKLLKIITDTLNSPKPQLKFPRGIYYTHDCRLLVSSTHNNNILELKEDGTYMSTIEGITQPGGLILRHDGKIVVTSNVKQMLFVLSL